MPAGLGEGEISEFVEDDEVEAREIIGEPSLAASARLSLELRLGPLSWERTDLNAICRAMDELMEEGRPIYSAAYIMPAPGLGHARKHANHLALLAMMMDDKMPDLICQAPTLFEVYRLLRRYPGIGPFLAFQYAIDLNYSALLRHDEGEFVVAGPGALERQGLSGISCAGGA